MRRLFGMLFLLGGMGCHHSAQSKLDSIVADAGVRSNPPSCISTLLPQGKGVVANVSLCSSSKLLWVEDSTGRVTSVLWGVHREGDATGDLTSSDAGAPTLIFTDTATGTDLRVSVRIDSTLREAIVELRNAGAPSLIDSTTVGESGRVKFRRQ